MKKLEVRTGRKTDMVDVTAALEAALRESGVSSGLCVVFVPHTTAGIVINENADPSVPRDMLMALDRMVPDDLPYEHGEGNSPAHVKAALVGSSATVVVENGRMCLGRWQAVFLCEFDGPRRREIWVRVMPS